MNDARLPKFFLRPRSSRIDVLCAEGFLGEAEAELLLGNQATLRPEHADKMVENVLTTFGLPMGVAVNFIIDGAPCVVPMVVEEPSIIAALSSAAKTVANAGGFVCGCDESFVIGQVQVVDLAHPERALRKVLASERRILDLANSLQPNMVARGGGAKSVEARLVRGLPGHNDMLIVHLIVDSCDAMGANMVNTMCEGVAALIEEISCGRVFLRILSNLSDRALVTARVVLPPNVLANTRHDGEAVRDGIVLAGHFAEVDAFRAATHNKGIMNGIDAVAIATGNDWRAIEAGAHAWAGRNQGYQPLTHWHQDLAGNLVGLIEMPLKVGTQGGNLNANPAVKVAQRLLGHPSAIGLAKIMAAVGLAQNFAALRALATDGIQMGHMTLHARAIVASANPPEALFEATVAKLLQTGDIKLERAKHIVAQLTKKGDGIRVRERLDARQATRTSSSSATGKVLLLGEHAVVFGSHALAVPLEVQTTVSVSDSEQRGVKLLIPRWGVETSLKPADHSSSLNHSLAMLLEKMNLLGRNMTLWVDAKVPRAKGLGSSAALAVAVVRALAKHFCLPLSQDDVIALAFEAEKVAHGNPSGVDNALAVWGRPLLFKRGEPPTVTPLAPGAPLPLVVGMVHNESLTARTVKLVQEAFVRQPQVYGRIFHDIDQLALTGAEALAAGDWHTLGELMNVNHGLLHALQVSTDELDALVRLMRRAGALGAKLTGGGGGGAVVALCPNTQDAVFQQVHAQGYQAFKFTLAPHALVPEVGHAESGGHRHAR